jgi:hypothetical protein
MRHTGLLVVFALSFILHVEAAKPKKGTAALSGTDPFEYALEINGYVPVGEWWIESKVTKVNADGFEFETLFFESADHPDFAGKTGKFLIRLPEGAKLPIAVDDQLSIRHRTERGACVENSWAILKDFKVTMGYHQRFSDVLVPLNLSMDEDDPKVELFASTIESQAKQTQSTDHYIGFDMPVELKSEPGGATATVALDEVNKKSARIEVGKRPIRFFVIEARRRDFTEKGKAELTCKKKFARQTVLWQDGI